MVSKWQIWGPVWFRIIKAILIWKSKSNSDLWLHSKTHAKHMERLFWSSTLWFSWSYKFPDLALYKNGMEYGLYAWHTFDFTLFSWVSVLQNSKEEALNTALGGDQLHLQDSGLQDLSRAIIAELRHMPGNEACADCGAPGETNVTLTIVEDTADNIWW